MRVISMPLRLSPSGLKTSSCRCALLARFKKSDDVLSCNDLQNACCYGSSCYCTRCACQYTVFFQQGSMMFRGWVKGSGGQQKGCMIGSGRQQIEQGISEEQQEPLLTSSCWQLGEFASLGLQAQRCGLPAESAAGRQRTSCQAKLCLSQYPPCTGVAELTNSQECGLLLGEPLLRGPALSVCCICNFTYLKCCNKACLLSSQI